MKKMWAMLVHLNMCFSTSYDKGNCLHWDEEMWDKIIDGAVDSGINTIIIDINNAIEFASHPEIAVPDAWSKGRFKRELLRCREKGLTLIPKLNFSTAHSMWLGPYYRMTSTPTYYKVCHDLIHEAYEMFEHPDYIHIGMDEESLKFLQKRQFVLCRQGELFWHDLRFLVDSVAETGAMPWIWSSPLFDDPEGFKAHFSPKEMLISPYHYNAIRREHWTPITARPEYETYYNEGEYASMGIKFVEEDPFLVHFMEVAIPLMKEGYLYAPSVSVFNRCPYNTHDVIEYFRDNAPDEQIYGYVTAPWFSTTIKNEQYFTESFELIKDAKEEFYNEK